MSDPMTEREAFEKWAGDYGFTKFDKTTTGAYKTFVSRALFDAFLAGRAHLSQPAQAVDVDEAMVTLACNAYFDALPVYGGNAADRDAMRAALTAALKDSR
jgi:hypothetical protein